MKQTVKTESSYFACATPPGIGGISVIRVAGAGAIELVDRVFTPIRSVAGIVDRAVFSLKTMPGYTAVYGRFMDPKTGERIDDVVCVKYSAPHSYTGEDIVEISCHGGFAVRQEIFRVLSENGGRPAEPGEFTRTAFLNGKIDLSQAEAVMDVISAGSEMALRAASHQLAGAMKDEIRQISRALYECFARLESVVEFPEEGVVEDVAFPPTFLAEADAIIHRIEKILQTFFRGRILREGMTIVLAGLPNSGKSSLLNRLAGYDRAIVNPQAGTTRDTIEVLLSIEKIPVRVIDTAGLRDDSTDEIERLGIARSREALAQSDQILWLIDTDKRDFLPDSDLSRLLPTASDKMILLIPKADILSDSQHENMTNELSSFLKNTKAASRPRVLRRYSSKTDEGLEELISFIKTHVDQFGSTAQDELVLTNERQATSIRKAHSFIEQVSEGARQGFLSPDMACALLRAAADALGEVTGDTVSDTLVQEIFSRFCIGK